jgi:site-specific DNA-cytosine methylase
VMVVAFGRSEEEKQRRKEHFQRTGKDSGSFKDKNLILKNQEYSDTLLAHPNPQKEGLIQHDYNIRRLTPRECFRLMDFPDSFTWPVSDSQAYKQAGNSIVVAVLAAIIKKLPL